MFTILLQTQHENNFLHTSKYRQAKGCRFRGICRTTASFIAQISSSENVSARARRHLGSGRKTVNSQGYSELWEPIKLCENY